MLFGAVVTTDKRSKKEKTELSDLRKSRHKEVPGKVSGGERPSPFQGQPFLKLWLISF